MTRKHGEQLSKVLVLRDVFHRVLLVLIPLRNSGR
jgi:hypothetical protein